MRRVRTDTERKIDGLLAELGAKRNAIQCMERAMAGAIERAAAGYRPFIERGREELAAIEEELYGLLRFHKAELFAGGRERVELVHGAVLRQVERRVKRVKDMLARLKAAGEAAAVKVKESVDWDAVDALPDERLARLRVARVAREVYSYEVKSAKECQKRIACTSKKARRDDA